MIVIGVSDTATQGRLIEDVTILFASDYSDRHILLEFDLGMGSSAARGRSPSD